MVSVQLYICTVVQVNSEVITRRQMSVRNCGHFKDWLSSSSSSIPRTFNWTAKISWNCIVVKYESFRQSNSDCKASMMWRRDWHIIEYVYVVHHGTESWYLVFIMIRLYSKLLYNSLLSSLWQGKNVCFWDVW